MKRIFLFYLFIYFPPLASAYFSNKKQISSLVKDWSSILPVVFYYDHLYVEQQEEITKAINEFYFNNEPLSEANQGNLTAVSRSKFLEKSQTTNIHVPSSGPTDSLLGSSRIWNSVCVTT
jgi:hypothetical protein